MAQAPASQVDPDPAKKMKTVSRSAARNAKPEDTCNHSVFYYENEKRQRMVCCACGRRRSIKVASDGTVTVSRWVKPRKKKEE